MTNLADLLPAGGGQNNTDFVADGNISAGAPVILTSDGKAAPISGSSDSVGSSAIFGGDPYYPAVTYDTANDKVVVAYRDEGDSGYAKLVVGTVSGTSISWGTPLSLAIVAGYSTLDVTYDVNSGKVVVAVWNSNTSEGVAGVGTVSGTSISVGTLYTFNNANTEDININYDSNAQKCVISYSDQGNSAYGTAIVATVSGTALSFGSEAVFASGTVQPLGAAFDSTSNKMIFAYRKNSVGTACVGTVSGTSISFGSEVAFDSGEAYDISVAHDVSQNKNLIAYRDVSNSNYGTGIVGTVSGTSISFGTGVVFNSAYVRQVNAVYDSNNTKTVIGYVDDGNSYYGTAVSATISGTTVSFTDPYVWLSGRPGFLGAGYDPDTNQVIFAYRDNDNSNQGTGICYTPGATNLTSTNLLGLAPSAISDTATGTINTWGSRCENNDFFGTVTPSYGTPTTAISAYQSESKVLAYDSANNRFVMAYKDGGNSDYGTAVVGELSGTSITWGTPVVFESATTGSAALDIAFDSNVNRIVIAYQDQGNSSYGTAIVGSVSGTGSGSTIAFGSPTIFESASTQYLSMTFDSNDNRIVIVYSDAGNSFYATYVIGTVTTGPDAISFNTPALLNGSSATYEIDASFDATENKVLVAYTDDSYDLYVLNLAISSGSGTPGTASSFGIGSPQQRFPRCVYDSVNGKSGVAYAEGTNLPIYFSVISMSGSNVTIETRVLAGDTSDSNYFMHNIAFDASIGQLAICTRDASANKGIAYYGSISGTTSSWTTSGSLFIDEVILPYGVDVAYDTSANKLAFVYTGISSGTGSVVSTLATTTLTIGSDYYVQTDGTLSTDTGGQLIGNAIKTNQINIKDYTG